MTILVEAQTASILPRHEPPSNMATMRHPMPDTLDAGNLTANETEGIDDVDEDEEEMGQQDVTAPELLNEVMVRSGYLHKRGEKRKVRWRCDNPDMEKTMGRIARIAFGLLQE